MAPDCTKGVLARSDAFAHRHLGPRDGDIAVMLEALGLDSLGDLLDRAVPEAIRWHGQLDVPALGENECLADLRRFADENRVLRSYLGMGYSGCLTPPVILRNILENPGWYTQYTAYQAEISQGRLEALFNFQTMIVDLTGLEIANSSLLDEATAAAEAMTMFQRVQREDRNRFFVDADTHPQTIAVVETRAAALEIEVVVGDWQSFEFNAACIGALVSYPTSRGAIHDYDAFCSRAHDAGAFVVVAADLLALTLLREPGAFGADACIGNSQRFGVPLGYGGPHAAFMAATSTFKRQLPGRIIGLSKDASGNPALRLALQTREQHIRRDKATSNICTAQVLLAVVAAMYASYHGPDGLRHIARRVHAMTDVLASGLSTLGCTLGDAPFFDTIVVAGGPRSGAEVVAAAQRAGINLRRFGDGAVGVALDETVGEDDVRDVFAAFGGDPASLDFARATGEVAPAHCRTTEFMKHPCFHRYRSETELMRYCQRLQARDLSLTTSMIPLGSCTMKLNATAEMLPISWPGFCDLHPFVPLDQARGYTAMIERLEAWLCQITGFAACSLQPNAGSQGEYTGLQVIRALHAANGQSERKVCVIPSSAHGTNPASAKLAGMDVVVVTCDDRGNIDIDDLKARCSEIGDRLGALMITYPSTHGVFEETVQEICAIVHAHGGQVYLDGANMNAMVGVARPGDIGADVCHLNLHKTFCIPHGGGGPGMGPICVAGHLEPFLPGHPVVRTGGAQAIGAVAAAPWGSPSILPISYAYIAMMGGAGLVDATAVSILNANYIAKRLEPYFPVLYRGQGGWVAHECILDTRDATKAAGITVDDIAKRLMDYGFHAPTMSWPVAGTLMVEPTESESKEELDRFCDAMIAIRAEIRDIESGHVAAADSPLAHAPHTAVTVTSDDWDRSYTRSEAAFPAPWLYEHKYWPHVSRVDNVHGDRHLVCSCPPVEAD